MTANTSTQLAPNTPYTNDDLARLSDLSDGDLLANTRRLVGGSNQLVAALLLHLGEVEARGLHRTRACSSLYTYCIYELRLSEDEACRRVAAARFVRRFPELLAAVAKGELHLTGLLLLGPHFTPENAAEVLARARHRTKKEIAKLVRELAPLPDVPARIEPLGPAPARLCPGSPTWQQLVQSSCPVRELAPGDRPADWVDGANDAELPQLAPAPAPPARPEAAVPTVAQRYRVEFTASEEYVSLVERAKALLSHAVRGGALEELHLRAMRALVAELEKRKYAVSARPTRKRHVPAAVRRAVFERDVARCSYVDARGERCQETHLLELHHIEAFVLGGEHSEENLTLRCASHNALAAEEDFGRGFMAERRDGLAHESAASVAGDSSRPQPLEG